MLVKVLDGETDTHNHLQNVPAANKMVYPHLTHTHPPNSAPLEFPIMCENHPNSPSHIRTDMLKPRAPYKSLIFQLRRQAAVGSLSPWKGSPTCGERPVSLPAVMAAGQAGINTRKRTGGEGDTPRCSGGDRSRREARLRKWSAGG